MKVTLQKNKKLITNNVTLIFIILSYKNKNSLTWPELQTIFMVVKYKLSCHTHQTYQFGFLYLILNIDSYKKNSTWPVDEAPNRNIVSVVVLGNVRGGKLSSLISNQLMLVYL